MVNNMGIASKPDDYLLKIKIQNNNIVSLMKENGIETIAELTRLTGVGSTVLCNLINMKDSPFSMTKNLRHTSMPWRPQVIKLADFFGVLPDEMFNYQQMYNPVKSNKAERSISEDNLHTLLPDFGETYLLEDQVQNAEKVKLLESALSTLTPREEKVLRARYGLDDAPPMTLEEVAVANDVTRERIRQIEQKAFRKMRNPDRADILKQAFDLQQANGYEREEAAVTFVLNARQKKIVRDCKQNADVRKAIKEHNIHEKSAWAYFEEIRAKEDFKLEYLKND